MPWWLSVHSIMAMSEALFLGTAETLIAIPLMPAMAIMGDKFLPRKLGFRFRYYF